MPMLRVFVFGLLFSIKVKSTDGQQFHPDSLLHEIAVANNDTIRMILYGKLVNAYAEINPDSSYRYAEAMQKIAKEKDLKLEEAEALGQMGYSLLNMDNYPRSLQVLLSSVSISDDPQSEKNVLPERFPSSDEFNDRTYEPRRQRLSRLSRTLEYLGLLYSNAGNFDKSLGYYKRALPLAQQANNLPTLTIIYISLGRVYFQRKIFDSALINLQQAYDLAARIGYNKYIGSILLNIGRAHVAQGKQEEAKTDFIKALIASRSYQYFRGVVATDLALYDLYKKAGNKDSGFYYINDGVPMAYYLNTPDLLLRSYAALADYYKSSGINDSTVKYQSLVIKMNDSLFNAKQVQQFQNIDFDEQQRQQQREADQAAYRNKVRQYTLAAGLGMFLLIAFILYQNNRQKQKANVILTSQKQKVEETLQELKSTQSQLIQSEKMASLGELTAGIAHEIQNPLNFVNNFSEVNKELIGELVEEVDKGNTEEVKAIAKDINDNSEKINYHGKRADAIVKGMLQHSRASSGQKELTDINALCDEYLRLAYHGLRAKDKFFNAKFETDFDNSIPKINIVPQEIGRVILNLINNAFYAASQNPPLGGRGAEPTVWVSTKNLGDKIQISVRDNGPGIPEKILDKIFQPFFTTKPTGSGTGLGLSLSYDIITKGHNGGLRVETKEGEYAEFIISLPIIS
jgi:signal transduction histidine kinase